MPFIRGLVSETRPCDESIANRQALQVSGCSGGMNIPDHELVARVGQGSYGEVWLARNVMGSYRAAKFIFRKTFKEAHPFQREMAGIQRFEPVSRTHPGFVHVLHVGRIDGEEFFYYLMEVADDVRTGQNIEPAQYTPKTLSTEIARLGRLPVGEAIILAKQLVGALAHLHEKGLVHRDIKPANIVFVNGAPKLADIGLVANLADARSYVGTEGFIPPEGPGSVRADIYSVGKVLYEAATGKDRQKFPELPSNIGLTGDSEPFLELNEIILKACDPEPSRRYLNAREMLAELELLDAGGSVRKARKAAALARRVKRTVVFASVVALAAAAIFFPMQRQRTAEKLRVRESVRAELEGAAKRIDLGSYLDALPHYLRALRIEGADPLRVETHRMRISAALEHSPRLAQMWFLQGAARWADFSPDGKTMLLCDHQVNLEVIGSSENGTAIMVAGLREACFSPDGQRVLAASTNGFAALYDLHGEEKLRLKHPAPVNSATFSANGKWIVTSCDDGIARIWDAASGEAKQSFTASGRIWHAVLSADETLLATAGNDGKVILWNAATGAKLGAEMAHAAPVVRLALSPDRKRLATACLDGTARLWKTPTGEDTAGIMRHENPLRTIEFSPDGRFILTASHDGKANLWQANLGVPARPHPELRNSGRLNGARFDATGRRIVTASADSSVRLWDLAESWPAAEFVKEGDEALLAAKVKASPAPRVVGSYFNGAHQRAMVAAAGQFRLWDSIDGQPITPPVAYGTNLAAIVFLDDAKTVVAIELSGKTGRVWKTETDEHTLEELSQLSGLLSNEWLDLQPSLPDIQRVWKSLSVSDPNLFRVSDTEARRWHQRQLEAARAEKNPTAILFHESKLKEFDDAIGK